MVSKDQQTIESIRKRLDAGKPISTIIDEGYFNNTLKHPNYLERDVRISKCPHCGHEKAYATNEEYIKDYRRKYWNEDTRLLLLFRQTLCEYYGLNGNVKKVQQALELAWDRGHSSGYHEVANEFADLVPLVE